MEKDEPITLILKKPIAFGSETITELKIREPVAGDLRDIPMDPKNGHMLDLLGRLSNKPAAIINRLSIPDMAEAMGIVGKFISGGPGTGDKSSDSLPTA